MIEDDNILSDQKIDESGKALLVQSDQLSKAESVLYAQHQTLDSLSGLGNENSGNLDTLLLQAKKLAKGEIVEKTTLIDEAEVVMPAFQIIDTVLWNEEEDWDSYMDRITAYAQKNGVNLTKDPFEELLSDQQKKEIARMVKEDYRLQSAQCDQYDYAIASMCGVAAGLIDSLFVGMPGASRLEKWSNKMTDNFVIRLAGMVFKKDYNKQYSTDKYAFNPIYYAINDFEEASNVNYDQITGQAASEVFNMRAANHHIKSWGHSPDIFGLIFSIVDQFNSTSHFLDNGRIIVMQDTDEQLNLRGKTFPAKLWCGFVNWLGHLISDMAGSTSTRKKGDPEKVGTGIPMPFFSLFQLIGKDLTEKEAAEGKKSIADLSVQMFEEEYDLRFGLAQSIPVVFNELSIRLLWSLKSKYYHGRTWKESIPFGGNKPELRRMLLMGHGVLCVIDAMDSGIRATTLDKANPNIASNPTVLNFALRLNFTGWKRLAFSGMVEVRALYNESAIDIKSLDDDLKREWIRLADE